jgi:hypothetical protein
MGKHAGLALPPGKKLEELVGAQAKLVFDHAMPCLLKNHLNTWVD